MCEKGLETIDASKNGTKFLKIDFLILIRAMEEKQKRKLEKVRKAALLMSNARVHVYIYIYIPFHGVYVSRFKRCCVFDNPIRSTRIYPALPPLFALWNFVRSPSKLADKSVLQTERERERMAMKKSSEKLRLRINRRRSRR